jgi:hypothetical protein
MGKDQNMLRCGESQPLYAAMQQKIDDGFIFVACRSPRRALRSSRA